MENRKVPITTSDNYPLIECDCGRKFVVIAILEETNPVGEVVDYKQAPQVNNGGYCFYCGKEFSEESE